VIALIVLGLALQTFVPTMGVGDTVPALPLVDQSGHAFTFADFHGNVTIVSFIYTSCGDAKECPLIAAKFGHIQQSIGSDPIRLVTLTLDPLHDTPERLRAYGETYAAQGSRWKLATGTPAAVEELVARFGITSLAQRSSQGFAHDDAAIVIDRAGRIAKIIPGNAWTAGDLLAVARSYAGAPVNTSTALRLWLADAAERCGGGTAVFTTGATLVTLAIAFVLIGFAFARAFAMQRLP
jgi:cytochrome oxidase Cu insertion factor (SCO1/SenC/PrrC family)